MRETHLIETQRSTQFRPAIGGGGRLPRRVLVWEGLIALAVVMLLLVVKHVVAAREVGPDPLASLPGGQTVVVGLDIGGVPDDQDLEALATSYNVDGLVNISGPSVVEQVTASSLNLKYLHLPVPTGAAPTLAQLQTLASFMRSDAAGGEYVYLHDDVGGARVATTASMLLLLRGVPWSSVQQEVTVTKLKALNRTQSTAIKQLILALGSDAKSLPGNAYSGARIYSW